MQDNHTKDRQKWLRELSGTKPKPFELAKWLAIMASWAIILTVIYLEIAKG